MKKNSTEFSARELLERAVNAGLFPGAAAQWGSGSVVVGQAELVPAPVPMSLDTWFDLASLTKPLATTTLTLLALRSGAVWPKMRVGEVLVGLGGAPIAGIEVHDLLTHTSGLPAWLPLYSLCEGRIDVLQARLAGVGLGAKPGARVEYSCIGFVILGMMLEEISARPLKDLFSQLIAEPLGISDQMGFLPDRAKYPVAGGALLPLAEEQLVRERGLDPRWIPAVGPGLPDDGNARFLGGCGGNAGLFGTVDGVYRLAREYRRGGGGFLSIEEVELATRNHTPELEQGRGFGWQLAASPGCSAGPGLDSSAIGHTGFTGVSVWIEPGNGSCRVLLSNRNHPAHRGTDLHPVRRRFHSLT